MQSTFTTLKIFVPIKCPIFEAHYTSNYSGLTIYYAYQLTFYIAALSMNNPKNISFTPFVSSSTHSDC